MSGRSLRQGDAVTSNDTESSQTASALAASHSTGLAELLDRSATAILVTTYQAGKLVTIRQQNGVLNTHFRDFPVPMGLAGGVASIDAPLTLLGSHDIVASYQPSSNFEASGPASLIHTVVPYAFQPGPLPGQYILVVGGTMYDDNIDVQVKDKKNGPDDFQVHIHPKGPGKLFHLNTGNQAAPGKIVEVVVYGLEGDDDITVHTHKTSAHVYIFGGQGDDKLKVKDGPAVLIGGAGNDQLEAGDGPSLLVGGSGSDKLKSGGGYTALVGGSTDYDVPSPVNLAALHSLIAAIGSGSASSALIGSVSDDDFQDEFSGGSGLDVFFANLAEDVIKKKNGDLLLNIV